MSHNTSIYKSNNFFKNKTLVSNRNNIAIIIPIIIGHDFGRIEPQLWRPKSARSAA